MLTVQLTSNELSDIVNALRWKARDDRKAAETGLARLLMWDLVELRQGQDAQPELHPTRAAYRLYEWLGEKQKTLTQQGA